MHAPHRRGRSYLSIMHQRDEDPKCHSIRDQLKRTLPIRVQLIGRPTTAVPWSSSSSSALQNMGVSYVVGSVRKYGPHFVCMSCWPCASPSVASSSCAQASSHIMHSINPTQPLCNPCAHHALKPKREGRGDVRVESVIVRGSVNRVHPSCNVHTIRTMSSSNDGTKSP